MALSDLWTRLQLRNMVRTELLDPAGKFWPDAELNTYLERWQTRLQSDFEFVWGTATAALGTGTATLTLSAVASDMMRLDAIYWATSTSTQRLVGRSKEDLDILKRNWREDLPLEPRVAYQDDFYTVSVWPPPQAAGSLIFEYPKVASFGGSDSPMVIPAWTRYSAKNFCVHHALLRTGPNQDLDRAKRRKAKFEKQLKSYRTMFDNFFPDKALTLRPGGKYEIDILDPMKWQFELRR